MPRLGGARSGPPTVGAPRPRGLPRGLGTASRRAAPGTPPPPLLRASGTRNPPSAVLAAGGMGRLRAQAAVRTPPPGLCKSGIATSPIRAGPRRCSCQWGRVAPAGGIPAPDPRPPNSSGGGGGGGVAGGVWKPTSARGARGAFPGPAVFSGLFGTGL